MGGNNLFTITYILVLLQLSKSALKPRFLAIANPIETAVLGSLLMVSSFRFW